MGVLKTLSIQEVYSLFSQVRNGLIITPWAAGAVDTGQLKMRVLVAAGAGSSADRVGRALGEENSLCHIGELPTVCQENCGDE